MKETAIFTWLYLIFGGICIGSGFGIVIQYNNHYLDPYIRLFGICLIGLVVVILGSWELLKLYWQKNK